MKGIKLVRENIPHLIQVSPKSNNLVVVNQKATGSLLLNLLKKKVVEEAIELAEADYSNFLNELADLYEVLEMLRFVTLIHEEDILSARFSKNKSNANFMNGRMIILDQEVKTWELYFPESRLI